MGGERGRGRVCMYCTCTMYSMCKKMSGGDMEMGGGRRRLGQKKI